jgi:hypothetical protein
MDHRRLFHQGVAGKQIDLWMALTRQFMTRQQPVGITRDKGGSMTL